MSEKISAFVITCDKDPVILRAVLAAARFADDLVLIDKGRNPGPIWLRDLPRVNSAFRLPWSPTVEGDRATAVSYCEHDWIVCLDDDEILSPACAGTFRDFIASGDADVLGIPTRHYVLGRHDPAAYYWPEWRPALFRRGAIEFGPTVHGGTRIVGKAERLSPDHAAFITHLSHPDIATWLEKTNRYTSQYAQSNGLSDYRDAVAVLRGLYDIIDGLKQWEATQPDGHAAFAEIAKAEIERQR
jgi:hypothetical protein